MGDTEDSGTLSEAAGEFQSEVLVETILTSGEVGVVARRVGTCIEDGTHGTRAGNDAAVVTPARIDTNRDRDLLG